MKNANNLQGMDNMVNKKNEDIIFLCHTCQTNKYESVVIFTKI